MIAATVGIVGEDVPLQDLKTAGTIADDVTADETTAGTIDATIAVTDAEVVKGGRVLIGVTVVETIAVGTIVVQEDEATAERITAATAVTTIDVATKGAMTTTAGNLLDAEDAVIGDGATSRTVRRAPKPRQTGMPRRSLTATTPANTT